jgi:rare lipoprotein A
MIPIAPRSDTPGLLAALALCAMLAGCGTTRYRPVSDYPVKIGRPYSVRGTTYRPADLPAYDAVGMASWYGRESGNQTANGERFRVKGISAAHTVLPLPSYVEVTALDTGRTILLRINDRGPFTPSRLIDLSRGAARLLGIERLGRAAVRVRRVEPDAKDRARLRAGKQASARPDASPDELAALRARLTDQSFQAQ